MPVTVPLRAPEALHAAPLPAPPAGGRPPPSAAPAAGPVPASAVPNPALRMDPELGLVVLEFRDSRGETTATFPTSRELEAYRRAARTGAPPPAS